jgi:hypothetical protein
MHLPTRWIVAFALVCCFAANFHAATTLRAESTDQPAQPAAALNQHVFVPLAIRLGGAQGAPGGGLNNGGFESGAAGWTVSSTFGRNVIRTNLVSTVAPHTGSYAAWLGGLLSETTSIQQQVAVSAAAPHLAYWHWIGSNDYCGYDKATVRINGAIVDTYNLCYQTATGGWAKHVINLSAYAGQSVTLEIRARTDSSFNSNLFIDDIGFQSAPAALAEAPAAEPIADDAPTGDSKPIEPPAAQAPAEALADTPVPSIEAPASELKPDAPMGQAPVGDTLTDMRGE